MNYKEILDVTNKFMEDTNIRKYCKDICKGKCCGNGKEVTICKYRNNCTKALFCTCFVCKKLVLYVRLMVDVDLLSDILSIHQSIRTYENLWNIDKYSTEFYEQIKNVELCKGKIIEHNLITIKKIKKYISILIRNNVDLVKKFNCYDIYGE